MKVSKEITTKYNISTWDEYVTDEESKIEWCELFLRVTDHIPNKIIEAETLGETPEDYTEILKLRQEARNIINGVESEGK